MHFLKKREKSIQLLLLIILSLLSFYFGYSGIAFIAQYPPIRGDLNFVFWTGFFILTSILSALLVKRITKRKISKEACYFIILVLAFSFSAFIVTNVILKLAVSVQTIVSISVLVSTPFAIIAAGYSKRTLMGRLKRLGLNHGITLISIFLLASIPILQYPFYGAFFNQQATILPDSIFGTAENTTQVEGYINDTGFFAKIPFYNNRTSRVDRIVNLTIGLSGNEPIDLHFGINSFKGDFDSFHHFTVYFTSNVGQMNIVNIENGLVQSNQEHLSGKSRITGFLGVNCTGAQISNSNMTLSLSISIFFEEYSFDQKINLILEKTS